MAPISNDLLLAAALTSAVPAVLAQPVTDASRPRTGVATTIKAGAVRGASTTMYIDGTTNQRLTTDANSTMHVLFSDQSAVTLGPDSELVIAKYQFDAKAREGQILIDLTKGLLRVVGGLISKKTATEVRTSTATIGIRGGIANVAAATDGKTTANFAFGQSMSVTDNKGNTQTVTRAGFGVDVTSGGVGTIEPTTKFVVEQQQSQVDVLVVDSSSSESIGNVRPDAITVPPKLFARGNLKDAVDNNDSSNTSRTLHDILAAGQVPTQS